MVGLRWYVGLVHICIVRGLFLAIDLTQRNLFEVSVVSLVICIASAVRALVPVGNEMPGVVKKPTAAWGVWSRPRSDNFLPRSRLVSVADLAWLGQILQFEYNRARDGGAA